MKIREMVLLVRVAETGSMTQAAKQLHLTPGAVSAAVQRIEGDLGLRIFERTTRSLHPTVEGQVVVEACQDVVDRWERGLEEARGQRSELEGTVHLSAPADTTYEVLGDVIDEVCAAHPDLRIVIDVSDAVKHLHGDAIDIAIRYGRLEDSSLSARKLAEAPAILVASPAYIDQHGMPLTPEELVDHRCVTLHIGGTPSLAWRLERDDDSREIGVQSQLCGDGYLARRWALAGRGIARKSLFDAIDDLEAGRLVRVLPDYTSGHLAVHAVFPSHRYLPARVRVLDDAIRQRFAARSARCRAWLDATRSRGTAG